MKSKCPICNKEFDSENQEKKCPACNKFRNIPKEVIEYNIFPFVNNSIKDIAYGKNRLYLLP